MQIPRRLLLLSVLAAGLYLQASSFSAAQQPGAVTLRAQTSTTQTAIPQVTATVDRKRVPLGETVTFTLAPAWVLNTSRYRVTLFFGDGSRRIMRQPQTTHLYQATGTYTYSILVEPAPITYPTPDQAPTVRLSVSPLSVDTKTVANFAAELSRNAPNTRFMFVFGDGTSTDWQTDAKTTHIYRSPKTYLPYVDIGVAANGSTTRLGGSTRQTVIVNQGGDVNANRNGNTNRNQNINQPDNRKRDADRNANRPSNQNPNRNTGGKVNQNGDHNSNATNANSSTNNNTNSAGPVNGNVNPSPSATPATSPEGGPIAANNWWLYLIIIALLLLGAYHAAKYLLVPKPTFVPNFDPGHANLGGNKSLGFDFQLDLDPNVGGGESKIETRGGSLIKTTRTK